METTTHPAKHGRIYGILGTLAWMIVAFIGGIFVGMHQEWIPNMPWAWHPDADQTPSTTPHIPETQPAPDNSTGDNSTGDNLSGTPQTQPSHTGR
jgi:hypothetical protein